MGRKWVVVTLESDGIGRSFELVMCRVGRCTSVPWRSRGGWTRSLPRASWPEASSPPIRGTHKLVASSWLLSRDIEPRPRRSLNSVPRRRRPHPTLRPAHRETLDERQNSTRQDAEV